MLLFKEVNIMHFCLWNLIVKFYEIANIKARVFKVDNVDIRFFR